MNAVEPINMNESEEVLQERSKSENVYSIIFNVHFHKVQTHYKAKDIYTSFKTKFVVHVCIYLRLNTCKET